MVTYNHEAYIAKALDSILSQEVDFEYEIVVGEDCSTDQTRNILLDYKSKYPQKIKLILQEKNVGPQLNGMMTFNSCEGEYIALLDGDDYWTDNLKLQKQVDMLDCNPKIMESFHKVRAINFDNCNSSFDFPVGLSKTTYELEDVLSGFFIPTLSVVLRRSAINKLPPITQHMTNVDWLIHVLCAEKGSIGYIDEVMGVYREHAGGVWSSLKRVQLLENTIQSAYIINRHLYYKYDRLLRRRIADWHREAGSLLVWDNAAAHATSHYLKFLFLRISYLLSNAISRVKNS